MKRALFACLCLVLVVLVSCKKKSDGRIKGDGYVIEESLDSLPLVAISDKEAAIIDLGTYDVLASYALKTADVRETFLFKGTLFTVCKHAVYRINIEDGKVTRKNLDFEAMGACGLEQRIIIWGREAIYRFNRNDVIEKIASCDASPVDVQPFPGYGAIVAVLSGEDGFEIARYSLLSKELERKEQIKHFVKMRISPFGKRIYVLTKEKLLFLDAKNLRFISEIPFEGEGVDFVVTASENKVFVFTRDPAKIISIKRTVLKRESESALSFPPSLTAITSDGGTIFFLAADSIFRFDTGSNAIVKTAAKRANEVDVLLATPKGLRVVLAKRGEKEIDLLDGNTFLLDKEFLIEGGLLHVICGAEAFRSKEVELIPDTVVVDSSAIESIGDRPRDTYFTLQVSSSGILEGALKLMRELKEKSLPAFIDSSETKDGVRIYRVKMGAFETRADAEKFSRGLKGAYGVDSWISKQEIAPFYLSEAGIDISGDRNGELLLYEKSTLYLFSNLGGVQKSVLTKEIKGAGLNGMPIELHEDNVVLLGVSIKPDSLVCVRWFDNRYEVVMRKALQQ